MKHRKYDTIIIGIDKENTPHQLCHCNTSCFADYLWETISIGNKKRFEMRTGNNPPDADGHKIAALNLEDLSDYFKGFVTGKMSKALKENCLQNIEFEKFLVIDIDSTLSGIVRQQVISVSFHRTAAMPVALYPTRMTLAECAERILQDFGYRMALQT